MADGRSNATRNRPPAKRVKYSVEASELTVRRIMQAMLSGRWVTGKSHLEFQQSEGLAKSTIEHYASEASRRIKTGLTFDDELRAVLAGALQQNASDLDGLLAAVVAQKSLKSSDLRVAIDAIKAKTDVYRALLGVKDLSRAGIDESLEKLSTEQLREMLNRNNGTSGTE